MSFSHPSYPEEKEARYQMLLSQCAALLDETLNPIANLANIAALLADALPQINWCGFYLMDHGALTLGPFCGLPACARIQPGRGVCGTAAATRQVQVVQPYKRTGFCASPMFTIFPATLLATVLRKAKLFFPFAIRGASLAC